jgi:hypothetical protein
VHRDDVSMHLYNIKRPKYKERYFIFRYSPPELAVGATIYPPCSSTLKLP